VSYICARPIPWALAASPQGCPDAVPAGAASCYTQLHDRVRRTPPGCGVPAYSRGSELPQPFPPDDDLPDRVGGQVVGQLADTSVVEPATQSRGPRRDRRDDVGSRRRCRCGGHGHPPGQGPGSDRRRRRPGRRRHNDHRPTDPDRTMPAPPHDLLKPPGPPRQPTDAPVQAQPSTGRCSRAPFRSSHRTGCGRSGCPRLASYSNVGDGAPPVVSYDGSAVAAIGGDGMSSRAPVSPLVAVGLGQPHIRDLSTSSSQPGEDGSKPCSTSQRNASRLRSDHHARITSRSTSLP
jgi:hypothetical protein